MGQSYTPHSTLHIYRRLFSYSAHDSPTGVSADRRQHKSTGALVLSSLRDLQLPTRITSLSRLSEIEHITGVFLDNIIAPYLEEFSFPNYYTRSMRPMDAITSFLRRSACSLLSLSICFSNYRPYIETFTNLLQSMPSLNTLSLLSVTTPICHGYAYRDGYDPWNILQLVAKVLSSQNTSLQQNFYQTSRLWNIPEGLIYIQEIYGDLYSLPPANNALHGPFHSLKLELHPYLKT